MSYFAESLATVRAGELQREAASERQAVLLQRARWSRQRAERAARRAAQARRTALIALTRSL